MTGRTLTSMAIGHHLARLRDQVGLKQAELARKVTWSPAVLSRVESGERELSAEELEEVLQAIGSDEALKLRERIQRQWQVLPQPSLDHPEQELLWEAELATQQLRALSASDDVSGSFQRRLDEYQEELQYLASLVQKREHTVAFIGSIGIGKSTAICRMTGLEVQEGDSPAQPVLEAGAGGITVCEVHLQTGPQYGITVEPCSDEEIRQHVADFADHISHAGAQGGGDDVDAEADGQGISREIERAIRNMAGLRLRKEKIEGKTVRRDDAKEMAQRYGSTREVVVEVLSRMELHRRDTRHVWYDPSTGKAPLAWLKETFEAINNGRLAEFTLPKRIEVVVPVKLLDATDLTTRLIDTKGIDRTAARADLEMHLQDPHTLAVLCSGFNNAPGAEARLLLTRAREAGIRNLALKAAVVALPRPEEALAVKDDGGERVESAEEGYELKGEQVATALEPLGLADLSVGFFNAREDAPSTLQDFVVKQLLRVREDFSRRLQQATENIHEVIRNREREQTQAVIREAAGQLRNWLTQNADCPPVKQQLQGSLMTELVKAHASTIHAAVRRGGDWPNLNYSNELGHGARVLAASTLGRRLKAFQAVAENLRTNPDYAMAVSLVSQAEKVMLVAFDGVLAKMRLLGETLFEEEMRRDAEFWRNCENEWGKGPGYRDRIVDRSKQWFDDERKDELNRAIQALLSSEWADSVSRVSALLDE
ncbi:TPA: helix-turn-helix transcriptional regulator [Burkholderia stabilis]|uniref:helix-turn-helix domain-containing protein n=2 Tax=Burkholderia cepacia complex TaxID=87882 RepID=UPI0009F5B042|nr:MULTISPECIES: helix-turn-helix transcriptional regulator [Burkholderia cepacia complex]MBJ9698433.1 helix-turn-helix transcriptional regulator [Burkholderia cenocepacia]HDR9492864.1 helix-turn-helix transcriptional regulator [Burkholderia stabilis]HDR9523374.1 helix-turn-helix transcriptional regulator [Burkholderia stabilis]HDR9530535.1 helix-turn-helix transcriptional regulator [Burkholderia stabilis]HDR9538056.1 helix-turn-helix transcriptional regulator [Burkholderia stabilis]